MHIRVRGSLGKDPTLTTAGLCVIIIIPLFSFFSGVFFAVGGIRKRKKKKKTDGQAPFTSTKRFPSRCRGQFGSHILCIYYLGVFCCCCLAMGEKKRRRKRAGIACVSIFLCRLFSRASLVSCDGSDLIVQVDCVI